MTKNYENEKDSNMAPSNPESPQNEVYDFIERLGEHMEEVMSTSTHTEKGDNTKPEGHPPDYMYSEKGTSENGGEGPSQQRRPGGPEGDRRDSNSGPWNWGPEAQPFAAFGPPPHEFRHHGGPHGPGHHGGPHGPGHHGGPHGPGHHGGPQGPPNQGLFAPWMNMWKQWDPEGFKNFQNNNPFENGPFKAGGGGGGCRRGGFGGFGGFGGRGGYGGPWGWKNHHGGRNWRRGGCQNNDQEFTPSVDLFDTPEAFVVHVALAGALKSDIGINYDFDNSELEISGVVHRPGDEEFLKTIVEKERCVGAFNRKIKLESNGKAVPVDADAITAKLENGLLEVTVPKLRKSDEPEKKKIPIN